VKIVLDSNVIIAAFAARGLANSIFELCLKEHEICLSERILEEVESALESKLKMRREHVSFYSNFLRKSSVMGAAVDVDESVCRDRNDLHVLGLAEKAGAEIIISGDDDLLELRSFKGIPILSPREFLERQRKADRRHMAGKEAARPKKIHERPKAKYR